MGVLRTPDERFDGLPGYPFEPRYVDVEAKRMPRIANALRRRGSRGRAGGPARTRPAHVVIPVPEGDRRSRRRGAAAIAPDHIGFGRSDKLIEPTDYTFARHIDWLHSFVTALELRDVTLVVQDWGGPIGLSVLAREPDRFARVLATNTILHTCDPELAGRLTWPHHGVGDSGMMLEETLLDYVRYYQRAPDIKPSDFLNAVAGPLPGDVLAGYDAPFPDRPYTAGLRQLTALIPLTRNDPGAVIGRATMAALEQWQRPFLTAYSDGDPATRGWDNIFQDRIPGAKGQDHVTVCGAGHFVQEQKGDELGHLIASVHR